MTLSVIDDALAERVTAHLSQFGQLARPVLWTGKGAIVVHFTTDLHVTATDTRFAPLTVNWSSTFRTTDGALYLNVPAAWRQASREAGEGEANTMPMYLSLSDAQQAAIRDIAGGDVYTDWRQGTLKALVTDGWISGTQEGGRILPPFALTPAGETMLFEYDVMRLHKPATFKTGQAVQYLKWGGNGQTHTFEWVDATVTSIGKEMLTLEYADGTSGTRRATSLRPTPAPILDPVAPIPANELENADEPCGDVGTLIDPEPANNLPDVQPADPYAWATAELRAALKPISEKLMPMELRPTKTEGVWLIEDAVTEKTMRRNLNRFGVTILGVEEDEMDKEPYTIARFTLNEAVLHTPYPSKRQTKPAADPNSIHAQYDVLHAALPGATFLLVQVNGDEWHAYQMDALLLRRYAPLCRFSPQTINQAGEQWDKLSIPAGVLDELLTNATTEGGLTVALASIVRDKPGVLPVRDVTEIHRPDEPVQYIGKEAPPTEWETEADAESEPQPEPAPKAEPAAPSKLDMTPDRMCQYIRLKLHGELRVGRIEDVRYDGQDEFDGDWWTVWFAHAASAQNSDIHKRIAEHFEIRYYDIGLQNKYTLTVRPKSTAPHGSAIEQATAVLNALPDLTAPFAAITDAFADAKARVEAFDAAAGQIEPTTLLSETDEAALIEALRTEHADIAAESLGVTQFLLNVISRMRTTQTVAAPF